MSDPKPIHLGRFDPMHTADIEDFYIDIAANMTGVETISGVAFTVTNSAGATVAGVVTSHTESGTRTDFRVTAPAVGVYTITAVFTISDGQKITRTATLSVV